MTGRAGEHRPAPGADPDGLRAGFRHGSRTGTDPHRVDTDAFLDRVHRGTRRRRTRRTAGAVAAALATVGVVVGSVTQLADRQPTVPAATDGGAAGPSLAVYDVDLGGDAVWTLASRDCAGGGLCPTVARSTDEGRTWDLGQPRTSAGDAALDELRHLAVTTDGTAVAAGTGLATSVDAGGTWQPVELASGREVAGVAAGATETVAVFDETGTGSIAISSGADWVAGDAPIGADERAAVPFAGGDVLGAVVLGRGGGAVRDVVLHRPGSPWVRIPAPCPARTPLVTTDGTRLSYLCYGLGRTVLASGVVSSDGTVSGWSRTELPAARDAGLGSWGDGGALVAADRQVLVVDGSGEVQTLSGPGSGLGLPRDDYTFRAADGGWLVSFRGTLLHGPDETGRWSEVPVR